MRDSVYFVSDVHLGDVTTAGEARARERSLVALLRHIRPRAEALYIVGDLFDFWFEYRWAVPRTGARVLFELHRLVEAGVPVVYLPGNHDIWLGSYLGETVGVQLPGGPLDVHHQGRRIHLAHGDEFRDDAVFAISRAVLKNRLSIALFRLVHPDLAMALARGTAATTLWAKSSGRVTAESADVYLRGAARALANGADLVICGHYHRKVRKRLTRGELVVLGDFRRKSCYGRLRDGEMSLNTWEY